MSLRRQSLLAAAVLLTACTGTTKLPVQPGDAIRPSGAASSRPRPTTASAEPLVVKPPTALAVLEQPQGASTRLSGSVRIDAHYAVRAAGAKLIGLDGGTLIGMDGASLIGADGATLIGADGATLIGMDGASVYVGAGLIGADGGSLIGADGGTLVAAGAGNLIGKRKLALMQAPAPARFTLGTVLRAAAMEIQVRSMADGKPISLGRDAAGEPVFSVYTNVRGEYAVFLPPDLGAGNVIVSAVVPETRDARLIYGAVTDPRAAEAVTVDEDTSMASAYFREAFISRIEREILLEAGGANVGDDELEVALKVGAIADAIQALRRGVQESGIGDLPDGPRRARVATLGDALLAYVPLAELKDVDTGNPALPELAKLMAEVRGEARARLAADPAYFDDQPWMIAANRAATSAGLEPFAIRRPSDLPDFVLRAVLVRNLVGGSTSSSMEKVLKSTYAQLAPVDGQAPKPATETDARAEAIVAKVNEVMNAMLVRTMLVLAAEDKVALNAAIATMKATP